MLKNMIMKHVQKVCPIPVTFEEDGVVIPIDENFVQFVSDAIRVVQDIHPQVVENIDAKVGESFEEAAQSVQDYLHATESSSFKYESEKSFKLYIDDNEKLRVKLV